jgi:hypothetical protein
LIDRRDQIVRQNPFRGQNTEVTLAIVIIVLVALILIFIGFVVFRRKRRVGGIVATPPRSRRGGPST